MPEESERNDSDPSGTSPSLPDWSAIADAAIAGDRLAYARLMRLVTGYLSRWRANDFRGDWEDIIQDVLMSTLRAHSEGRFPTPAAFQAYVRQATRNRFVDRIRGQSRRGDTVDPEDAPEAVVDASNDSPWPPSTSIRRAGLAMKDELRDALGRLGEREKAALIEVYLAGKTYEEASESTSIPLGSLKRALRTGLSQLREILDGPD